MKTIIGTTTRGVGFTIYSWDNEIYFMDDNGDMLTWDLNPVNIKLVTEMADYIQTKLPVYQGVAAWYSITVLVEGIKKVKGIT